jgi:hypothetical protein
MVATAQAQRDAVELGTQVAKAFEALSGDSWARQERFRVIDVDHVVEVPKLASNNITSRSHEWGCEISMVEVRWYGW